MTLQRNAGWPLKLKPSLTDTSRPSHGSALPSSSELKATPAFHSAAWNLGTKKPPRNKTWSPWAPGRRREPATRALSAAPHRRRSSQGAAGLPAACVRSSAEMFHNLPPSPCSIFLSRRGHGTRARRAREDRRAAQSWRARTGRRLGRAGSRSPTPPLRPPPPRSLLFPRRACPPRAPRRRTLPPPFPGGGQGWEGGGGSTIT